MAKTILLLATLDTKGEEALFVRRQIEAQGHRVLLLDAGVLGTPGAPADITREEVARRGGAPLGEIVASGDKGACIAVMLRGAQTIARELHGSGLVDGVIAIGGAQGTEIGCAAMRELPVGVPKLMLSTVACGRAAFGPYVGTRDLAIMHSVADLQGLNFVTRGVLTRAAGAICGMVDARPEPGTPRGNPVALSMLGTTTPGALRAKTVLERDGHEVVAFHQNGTGGAAMEELIQAGAFAGVLDLNLHEIADRAVGGLHAALHPDRLEGAAATGLPQVIAPGSVNYMVLGPLAGLPRELRDRRRIVHNPSLTLVRLSPEELRGVGKLVAEKLSQARGPVHVFIPTRGFCFPDREGHPLWEPEGNQAFVDGLRQELRGDIPVTELDAHINDPEFADPVASRFRELLRRA